MLVIHKKMTKVLRGLEKNPTFEEIIADGSDDISDIGLYTRQPAVQYRNFFFASQADGIQDVVDATLDDKVSKILAVLQAQVEVEKQKTLDRRENTRQQFCDNLPRANNEPELGTGTIDSSSASTSSIGFDGSPPPLPPPMEPPGMPPGPVPALPLPPPPSFFNAPRRAAREQVERGRSPPQPTPGEGAPPPVPQMVAPGAALRNAPRVPDSSGSASTRSGGRRSQPSSSSSGSSGYAAAAASIPTEQLQRQGRAAQRNSRNPASAPPLNPPAPPRRRRRTRMDTPEQRRGPSIPYSGGFA